MSQIQSALGSIWRGYREVWGRSKILAGILTLLFVCFVCMICSIFAGLLPGVRESAATTRKVETENTRVARVPTVAKSDTPIPSATAMSIQSEEQSAEYLAFVNKFQEYGFIFVGDSLVSSERVAVWRSKDENSELVLTGPTRDLTALELILHEPKIDSENRLKYVNSFFEIVSWNNLEFRAWGQERYKEVLENPDRNVSFRKLFGSSGVRIDNYPSDGIVSLSVERSPQLSEYVTQTPVPVLRTATPVFVNNVCPQGCVVEQVGCTIKGNVNSKGEKIFHASGDRDYNKVVMDLADGDLWFCTFEDAVANGFRHAQQ